MPIEIEEKKVRKAIGIVFPEGTTDDEINSFQTQWKQAVTERKPFTMNPESGIDIKDLKVTPEHKPEEKKPEEKKDG